MAKDNQHQPIREELDSQLAGSGVDAAGLDGHVQYSGADRSLSRATSDYDENSGPGGASGIADDPTLNGSTGVADDVGMHIEPGFSVGYDTDRDLDFTGDTGNEVEGGYLTLSDAAQGYEVSPEAERDPGLQTALGVPDAGSAPVRDSYSIETASGGPTGYGAEGTDSDVDFDQMGD